ncbi:MAG: GNAT family N-acetyltransferase [Cyanobacteria bacterium J06623_7]
MTLEPNAIARNDNWSELYQLGENYRQQQQWQNAVIALERAVELKDDFFWSWHNLGDVYRQLQQWQKAVHAYRQATQLDPQFFWSWHNLGDVYRQLQQCEKAVHAYRQATQLDPQFFWSWHNLGDVYRQLQQWHNAISSYLQGIYLDPQHQLSYQKLGTAFKQEELEPVIQHYRQLSRQPPQGSIFQLYRAQPAKLIDLLDSLTQQHQTQAAIAVAYMVLEIQPVNTDVLSKLNQLLTQQQQLEQTIAKHQQQLDSSTSPLLTQAIAKPTTTKKRSLPGQIVLQSNRAIDLKQLNNLCLAVGWSNRPLNRLKKAIDHSLCYVAAWHIYREQQQLVGFARAITDGVFQATLLDIAVHPEFQGQGIGKAIVKSLLKQLNAAGVADITLYASPHMTDFYHRLGFVAQPHNLQWMLFSNSNKPET